MGDAEGCGPSSGRVTVDTLLLFCECPHTASGSRVPVEGLSVVLWGGVRPPLSDPTVPLDVDEWPLQPRWRC